VQEDYRRWKLVGSFLCFDEAGGAALTRGFGPRPRRPPPLDRGPAPHCCPARPPRPALLRTRDDKTRAHGRKPATRARARAPQPQRYGFSFCRHPFVYDPASKARVLQLENQIAQDQQFENSMVQVRGAWLSVRRCVCLCHGGR
jgi:hypothetical protein